jgi:hypothetical protein
MPSRRLISRHRRCHRIIRRSRSRQVPDMLRFGLALPHGNGRFIPAFNVIPISAG